MILFNFKNLALRAHYKAPPPRLNPEYASDFFSFCKSIVSKVKVVAQNSNSKKL